MSSEKLPAMQFYPGDWRKDPGVQALDFFDRGVWFEVLCIMHESEDRGKLTLNGKAMPNTAAARLLGLMPDKWSEVRDRLVEYGVAAEDENGVLYNRRMVRDEEIRRARAEAGKRGGKRSGAGRKARNQTRSKTPAKAKQTPKQTPKQTDTTEIQPEQGLTELSTKQTPSKPEANAKQNPTPSVSSSSSEVVSTTSVGTNNNAPPPQARGEIQPPGPAFRELVNWLGTDSETALLAIAGTRPETWAVSFRAKWGPKAAVEIQPARKGLDDDQWRETVLDAVRSMALEEQAFRTPFFTKLVSDRAVSAKTPKRVPGERRKVGDTNAYFVNR